MLQPTYIVDRTQDIAIDEISLAENLELRMEGDSPELLRSLMQSIRRHGLLQPIIVRPVSSLQHSYSSQEQNGRHEVRYEIICGHRRFSACKQLGLSFISAFVTNLDNRQALEVALVENLQRENLNPIEEAEAFKKYVTSYGRGSITALAMKIGKSEEYVSHKLLLLGLPKEILGMISRRLLKPAQATELVWLKDPPTQIEMARLVVAKGLSFRRTRSAVRLVKEGKLSVNAAVMKVSENGEIKKWNDKSVKENHFDEEISDPWRSYNGSGVRNSRDLRAVKHATLVIRTCLSGLDALMDDSDNEGIRELFLSERREIHSSLDRLVKAKVAIVKELRRNVAS